MRSLIVAFALILLAGSVSGCTEQPETYAEDAQPPGIRLVAPEQPVLLGEEIVVIVEIADDDGPASGREVTFDVVSGGAAYPGGFESATTDAYGVATSLGLQASTPGIVTIRVASATRSTQIEIEIDE